jgi:CubicO group peptidase (beta-lactamase class C family)
MSSHLQQLLDDLVEQAVVPGVIVGIRRNDAELEYVLAGDAAPGQPMTPETIVPVASITKLATALAVLRLVAAGALRLDDSLAQHLPEAAAARDGVSLRRLLCHTSGLPGDLAPGTAPYDATLDWPALARACLATPLEREPGSYLLYSNIGPGLLAIVIERHTGKTFNDALGELVFAPLGIEAYLGIDPSRPPAVITGSLGEHEGGALAPYNSAFWRRLALPWGGLLTTACGAIGLVRAFAGDPDGFLPADLLVEATRDQTGGVAGEMAGLTSWPRVSWGLGPDVHGDKQSPFLPESASPRSFGHGGASGCLAWHDPDVNISWAMLGNRTIDRWARHWPALGDAILSGD